MDTVSAVRDSQQRHTEQDRSHHVLAGIDALLLWLKGKDAWNQYMYKHPETAVSFEGVEFGYEALREVLPNNRDLDRKKKHEGEEFLCFKEYHFDGPVSFEDAIFNDVVHFEKAYFNKKVTFSDTSFKDYANFRETIFAEDVNFEVAHFKEYADFEDAKFIGRTQFSESEFKNFADFNRSQFLEKVDFTGSVFSESATFDDAVFRRDANFARAQFKGGADFIEAQFHFIASFYQAIFGRDVSFDKATFLGESNFLSAEFIGNSYFEESVFESKLSFEEANFTGNMLMTEARFESHVSFLGATFKSLSDFKEAGFKGSVMFKDGHFTGRANFEGTTFLDDVSFEYSNFESLVNFTPKNTHQIPLLNFKGAAFDKQFILKGHFNCIPDLRQTKTSHHVDLSELHVTFKRCTSKGSLREFAQDPIDAERLCRLKEIADSNKNHERALEFNANELRAKRWHKMNAAQSILDALYSLLSNYGQSILRPFFCLVMTIWLFAAYSFNQAENERAYFKEAVTVSIATVTPFIAISKSERTAGMKKLYGDKLPMNYGIYSFCHAMISFIFIFLIGLGLRNRFRL